MRLGVTIVLIGIFTSIIHGQVALTIDRDSMQFGSYATVILRHDANSSKADIHLDMSTVKNLIYSKDSTNFTPTLFTVIDPSPNLAPYVSNNIIHLPADKINYHDNIWQDTFKLYIYGIGVAGIPCINDTNLCAAILVTPLDSVNMEDGSIQDIKPNIEAQTTWRDYQDYILYGILAILVLGMLLYIWSRWKSRKQTLVLDTPIVDEISPKEAPDVVALRQLAALRKEQIWRIGKEKDFQSGLTDTIKTYIEEVYQFAAMEMTTSEIVASLRKTQIPPNLVTDVEQILQIADLVKFAKVTSADEIPIQFLDKAETFIITTKSDIQ